MRWSRIHAGRNDQYRPDATGLLSPACPFRAGPLTAAAAEGGQRVSLTTSPPFITNGTDSSKVTSAMGSPATAIVLWHHRTGRDAGAVHRRGANGAVGMFRAGHRAYLELRPHAAYARGLNLLSSWKQCLDPYTCTNLLFFAPGRCSSRWSRCSCCANTTRCSACRERPPPRRVIRHGALWPARNQRKAGGRCWLERAA